MDEERSLADLPDQVRVVDATVPPTPENFDLESWIHGVRPTRRAVKLMQNGDLIAQMEQVVQQIDDAEPESDVDDLIDRYLELREQFGRGVWFTLEMRSGEWIRKFRNDTSAKLNLKLKIGRDGSMDGDQEKVDLVLAHQLAAQIVEPAGITADHVVTLRRSNAGEYAKLLGCLVDVNNMLSESAEVMGRDFSRRRSDNRATPES